MGCQVDLKSFPGRGADYASTFKVSARPRKTSRDRVLGRAQSKHIKHIVAINRMDQINIFQLKRFRGGGGMLTWLKTKFFSH